MNIDFDSKGQRAEISQQTNPYRLRRLLEYLIVNHDRGPSPLTHQRAALGRRKFYGRWFLAAAKAQALWKQDLKNPNFQKQVDRLSVLALPDFGIGATVLFSRLETNFASIIVSLNEEDETLVEEFAMMAAMGFFVLTGERYQMVIPPRLNMEGVKTAALKLAETEDENYFLHPEYLVATVQYSQAKEWQVRLRHMDEGHRCADRKLLLS